MKKIILTALIIALSFPAFSEVKFPVLSNVGFQFSARSSWIMPIQQEPILYDTLSLELCDLRAYIFNKEKNFFQYGLKFSKGTYDTVIEATSWIHEESLNYTEVSGIFSLYYPITSRFNVRGDFTLGEAYFELWNGRNDGFTEKYGPAKCFNPKLGFDLAFGLYITPNTIWNFGVGIQSSPGIYNGYTLLSGFTCHIPRNRPKLSVKATQPVAIHSCIYKYNNEDSLFKIEITNNEVFKIKKLTVVVPRTGITNKYSETIKVYLKSGETKEILIPLKLKESILTNEIKEPINFNIDIKYKAGPKKRIITFDAIYYLEENTSENKD